VKKLIAGPAVYICDTCIDLCSDILREQADRASVTRAPVRSPDSLIDPAGALSPLAADLQRAVQSLQLAALRTSGRPLLVSQAVDPLGLGAQVLEQALGEWKAGTRSLAGDAARARQEEVLWAEWSRARTGVVAVHESLRRLRLALSGKVSVGQRLALDEAHAEIERHRAVLDPAERTGGEPPGPLVPPDRRVWTVPVVVLPHLWTILGALREVREAGGAKISGTGLEVVDGALADITALAEQLGSELRASGSRPWLAELRARFLALEDGLSTVRRRIPESLPPRALRLFDQALIEVCSVGARLEQLRPGEASPKPPPAPPG